MSALPSARFLFLVAGLVGLLAPRAAAQVEPTDADRTAYVVLRGAVAGVEGDSKSTFDDTGAGLGLEAGLRLSPRWAVALAWWAQDLPALSQGFRADGLISSQGSGAYQGQALIRTHLLAAAGRKPSPFVEAGLAVVTGQGTEAARNQAGDGAVWGFGPVGGLGVDLAFSPRLGLRVGVQSTVVVPDAALDGFDASAFDIEADAVSYDVLTNASVGVRYAIPWGRPADVSVPAPPPLAEAAPEPAPPPAAAVPPPTEPPPAPEPVLTEPSSPASEAPETPAEPAPEITSLTCPAELEPGEEGAFAVAATAATTTTWSWGDGAESARGRHAFAEPGTYVVSATVRTTGGEASETCTVTVVDAVAAPVVASCRVTPSPAVLGKAVTVDADVAGADAVTVDLGDGAEADALPARYEYGQTGTFTVTITATNEAGGDACTATVTIEDPSCAAPLAPVRFKAGEAALTAGAMTGLDAAADLLGRCADVCLTLEGSATQDEGPAMAQRRADAVMFYLIGQGVDADRLAASGATPPAATGGTEDSRTVAVSAASCAGF
jgi:PKD repeat protein